MEPTDDKRRPRWVFSVGTEPDARFSMANERTFLAWIRTSLALLAGGVALEALDLPVHPVPLAVASVLLVALGILAPVWAWVSWARSERAVRTGTPLPAPTAAAVLTVGIVVAAVALLVGGLVS